MIKKGNVRDETLLASGGRDPESNYGIVNPPVYHASTITSPTLAEWRARDFTKDITYGRMGTPTQKALEEAVALVEGGDKAIAVSSGLAAITTAVSTFVESGDHILVTDSAYFPTRNFCNNVMAKYGVETTYYDPLIGGGIADLIQDNTKVVMTEAPGSQTFEVQDIPAISEAAHARGAVVINDNTWGTPLNFKSFDRGIDVSVHAATKYIVGHSDAMLGIIVTTNELYERILQNFRYWGQHGAPDDCYLGLRGLRTMGVRLKQHEFNALAVAEWLQGRPEVSSVLFPALPGDPGHELWKRDFEGAAGLFGVVLDEHYDDAALGAMLDGMELFAMGASWGGFESLILPAKPVRTATSWDAPGTLIRLHVGLEHPDDLVADLEAGFTRLKAVAG
ncbi:MAG: cystathionine beta-lyase [Alphaproteobacteria bacterium]|nr:cystathionine beta-lyase [Alphaproteobacteria bacterium]|tara:strand:+ start:1444 stop:2622 length:1179 start_codon:yes stop_codon:yes gene_type:complete